MLFQYLHHSLSLSSNNWVILIIKLINSDVNCKLNNNNYILNPLENKQSDNIKCHVIGEDRGIMSSHLDYVIGPDDDSMFFQIDSVLKSCITLK